MITGLGGEGGPTHAAPLIDNSRGTHGIHLGRFGAVLGPVGRSWAAVLAPGPCGPSSGHFG
eukprot:6813712-Pyramimonas_sp.AAC.1